MFEIGVSWSDAHTRGLSKYQGKPCRYGHAGIRHSDGACVDCRREASARWAKRNPEKLAVKSARRYYANRAKSLWSSARARAKNSGLNFNIEPGDITIPDTCPVLGIPMESPSLDRVDSTQGYVRGNIRVISWRANKLKSDATLDELRRLVAYVEGHQSSGS